MTTNLSTAASPRPSADDTDWPSVTVVVPTRDRPELLASAIAAIRAQDYPGRVRVLVVHDQSTPDPSLAEDGPQRSVSVIRNNRSPGLAGARNSGIEAADTELVAFCDDDDSWHADKLRVQVEALRAVPGSVLVTCGIRVRYGDHTAERSLTQGQVHLRDLLRSRLTELHPSTFLIVREALRTRIGLVDEEIPGSYAEDYEFLLRAARSAPIANVPSVHVDVLWHQKSFFTSRWDMIAQALSWLLERYPEFRSEPRGYARVAGQIAFAHAARGDRRAAASWAARTARANVREGRAYLALAVATGLVTPQRVLTTLHRRGRGI
jgi:glycosyltransferase involved in cell wall biosynthesis